MYVFVVNQCSHQIKFIGKVNRFGGKMGRGNLKLDSGNYGGMYFGNIGGYEAKLLGDIYTPHPPRDLQHCSDSLLKTDSWLPQPRTGASR